ncbi:S-adenosyl-L-methionine-dependent methyltransferase [Pseudomassariella vexata]|uniref:S-adenosyl-L-methionine-dependent methyltransferase n=1 Tax=Pseudomassariella vexata TaxID=1141098 RepID=A0A1Y2D5Z0_9PEZI|nr:S-adenosyl-L-methionine-dependent methyltransferase [Pseudomassariella vexata]ORY54703.1 S-adenosyl-L-methionine-dependent methyltransferase [Pseudomassariella vexata]
MGFAVHDASSLGVVVEFGIPNLVPLGGSATYSELSERSGLDEDRLTRILRYAMINFTFREEPAVHVRHTALSAHLARAPASCDFLRVLAIVSNPGNVCLPSALRRYPSTQSLTQTAHNMARGTDDTFYAWLEVNPDLRDNFDRGMEGISRGGQRLQDTDIRAYPWHALPEGSKVVDVGGSKGHFVRDLAELHSSFSFVVQDLPRVIEVLLEENKQSPTANVTYQSHNFFDEQSVSGAEVYFLRHVLHNHPDQECVDILKALLPALKSGARILASEYIMPAQEELILILLRRQMDLMAMALVNSKERTKVEYSALFARASPKLVLEYIYQVPDDPRSCIFEAIYDDQCG